MISPQLPDYERPPVVEVLIGVQFVPVPQFGMREAVAVSRAFDDWEVVDVVPALEPIVEAPAGHLVAPMLRFGLGSPPMRVVLGQDGEHWVAQVQQDRVVAHERKVDARPSFANVKPRLWDVVARAADALDRPLLAEPHSPELVEVIYLNRLPVGEGWNDFTEMHRVLRVFSAQAGAGRFASFEQAQVGFAYELGDEGEFAGRLRVVAEPHVGQDQAKFLQLQLISRRFVNNLDLDSVLERCHADVVEGFTAVTTDHMHEGWGRYR